MTCCLSCRTRTWFAHSSTASAPATIIWLRRRPISTCMNSSRPRTRNISRIRRSTHAWVRLRFSTYCNKFWKLSHSCILSRSLQLTWGSRMCMDLGCSARDNHMLRSRVLACRLVRKANIYRRSLARRALEDSHVGVHMLRLRQALIIGSVRKPICGQSA